MHFAKMCSNIYIMQSLANYTEPTKRIHVKLCRYCCIYVLLFKENIIITIQTTTVYWAAGGAIKANARRPTGDVLGNCLQKNLETFGAIPR